MWALTEETHAKITMKIWEKVEKHIFSIKLE